MAIMDSRLQFLAATALSTSGTGLAVAGSVIDLGAEPMDLGNGRPMYFNILVTTAVTSGGSATVEFQLCSDAVDPLAADASETIHLRTAAIPKATLVAGYQLCMPLPVGISVPYERYLGVQQNVGVAALTAGAITAWLSLDPIGWKSLPDAVN